MAPPPLVYRLSAMSDCTRRQFHAVALAGSAALLLPACRNGAAFDGSVTPQSGKALCSFSQFPSLASAGGSAVVDVQSGFPIVVVRTSTLEAIALSATCTHQFCIMNYAPGTQTVHCDCHRADFTLNGDVQRGPTDIPIPTYAATIDASGITVDIGG